MAIIPYNASFTLGKGYNSLNGESLGTIFKSAPLTKPISVAKGQEVEFQFSVIKSVEHLYESLDVSVDVDANVGPFFSMEGKFDFASKSSFNSQSVFCLLRVTVKNAAEHIVQESIDYNPEVLQMLIDGDLERFRRGFGDSFVEGIVTGGEYFTLYEFVCTDSTSHTEVKAELEMSAGTFVSGVDIKSKFQQTVEKVSKKTSTKIKTYIRGGLGEKLSNDINEITNKALNFPDTVKGENAVPYEVIISSYETLPLPKGPNYIQIEAQRYELLEYAKKIILLRTKRNDLEYICMNLKEYYYEKDSKGNYIEITKEETEQLMTLLEQTASYMSALTKHAVKCASNPTLAAPFVPSTETPFPVFTNLPHRIENCDFVTIFEEKDFTGVGNQLRKNKYETSFRLGIGDDKMSSIKIPKGLKVVLWANEKFSGSNITLTESCSDLSVGDSGRQQFDNIVSSMEVLGIDDIPDPGTDNKESVKTFSFKDNLMAKRITNISSTNNFTKTFH